MMIFITGGAKNGKSSLAQDLAVAMAKGSPHYYIATMIPCDQEDYDRIAKHVADRAGLGFETVECGKNILSCLDRVDPQGTFLLDSATALLMNELFPDPTSCQMDVEAAQRCAADLVTFSHRVKNLVVVSDFIYCDAARYDPVTEVYRKCLADIDRGLAQAADTVLEVCGGNIKVHKGDVLF